MAFISVTSAESLPSHQKPGWPAMYQLKEGVEHGGLMSYGASLPDLGRRAATYVDKISRVPSPLTCPWNNPRSLGS